MAWLAGIMKWRGGSPNLIRIIPNVYSVFGQTSRNVYSKAFPPGRFLNNSSGNKESWPYLWLGNQSHSWFPAESDRSKGGVRALTMALAAGMSEVCPGAIHWKIILQLWDSRTSLAPWPKCWHAVLMDTVQILLIDRKKKKVIIWKKPVVNFSSTSL